MTENMIKDIIAEITKQLDELKAGEKDDINFGTRLGLCEALSVIQSEVAGHDELYSLLDYDIDAKYLL